MTTPNSSIVMHQPHGGFGGTSADIQTQAKQILHFKRRMAEPTSEQTGSAIEQIIEARDYGFVDEVGSTRALARCRCGGGRPCGIRRPRAQRAERSRVPAPP